MSRCETCGNEYSRSITVTVDGEAHDFDSFECAIHALAPTCRRCGIRSSVMVSKAERTSTAAQAALERLAREDSSITSE